MAAPASESEIARLTAQQIKERLDKGEQLYFVDVRRHPDDFQIKEATYFDPESILASDHVDLPVSRDCLIITYCS
jgi:hypothetical protein